MTAQDFAESRELAQILYLAGQIAPEDVRDPDSTIGSQAEAAFEQVRRILADHDLTLNDVVYVTAYLSAASDFAEYCAAWRRAFPNNPPARTTVAATILAENALVELSVVAHHKPR